MSDVEKDGESYTRVINYSSISNSDNKPYISLPVVTLVSNTEIPLFSIKNIDKDITIQYGTVDIQVEGTKPVIFSVYKNGITSSTFANYSDYTQVSTDGTLVKDIDILSNGLTFVRNQIGGTILGKDSGVRLNLLDTDIALRIGYEETITISAISSNTSTIHLAIRWVEDKQNEGV